MIPDSALPKLRATCRTLQIIVLALAMGICIFAVIAVVQTNGQLTWEFPPVHIEDSVFLLMGLMTLVSSFVVPGVLTATATLATSTEDSDAGGAMQAAQAIQTRTIIGCALLEGGAFANLVAVFTHGYGPSLVMAGVLTSMIVLRFPTCIRYLERINNEHDREQVSRPSHFAF